MKSHLSPGNLCFSTYKIVLMLDDESEAEQIYTVDIFPEESLLVLEERDDVYVLLTGTGKRVLCVIEWANENLFRIKSF